MRVFLIVLVASIVPSILFWNFGLAHKVWPNHPMLLTTVVAGVCAAAVQQLLPRYMAAWKSK
jgi:hypothetical protein